MSKDSKKRIRTSLDTAEDICRIIYSGAHTVLGTGIAAGEEVINATAEALENFSYIGFNGWKVIARAGFAAKRGMQDTCSFFYRALANKEHLIGLKQLNEAKESIDSRLDTLITNQEVSKQLETFKYKKELYTGMRKRINIQADSSKVTIREEEYIKTDKREWRNSHKNKYLIDDDSSNYYYHSIRPDIIFSIKDKIIEHLRNTAALKDKVDLLEKSNNPRDMIKNLKPLTDILMVLNLLEITLLRKRN